MVKKLRMMKTLRWWWKLIVWKWWWKQQSPSLLTGLPHWLCPPCCSALLWCDRCDTMSWHCDVKLRLISDKISRTYCVAASPADPLGHNFKIDFWPGTLYYAWTNCNDTINCLFRLTTPKDFLKTNVQCTLYIPLMHAQKIQHRRWDVSSWWTGLF